MACEILRERGAVYGLATELHHRVSRADIEIGYQGLKNHLGTLKNGRYTDGFVQEDHEAFSMMNRVEREEFLALKRGASNCTAIRECIRFFREVCKVRPANLAEYRRLGTKIERDDFRAKQLWLHRQRVTGEIADPDDEQDYVTPPEWEQRDAPHERRRSRGRVLEDDDTDDEQDWDDRGEDDDEDGDVAD